MRHLFLKHFFIIFIIIFLLLGLFGLKASVLAQEDVSLPRAPHDIEETKEMGKEALKALPEAFRRAWEEFLGLLGRIWAWIEYIWDSYVGSWLKGIWDNIMSSFERERPAIEEEFKKEKEEMKKEVPEITKSIWERLKELIKW